MKQIIEFCLQRRVTVAMAAIAVLMFGAVAATRLPINLLPDLTYPSLTVETRFPGAAPAEIEALVTRPIEEAVGVVSGVQRVVSVSRPGLSQVTLEMGWKRNMDFAALDVRQRLDLVTLPREASKSVLLRFDPANEPIMRIYLSGSDDLFQLRYLGEEVLKKDLESTEGLAAIKVNGGYEEEIQVQIDEGKLALLGIGIGEIRDRLARENINQAGGSLYEEEARYLVRSRNEFEDTGDILDTVIRSEGGRLVTLGDVATVRRGHRQREVITRFDGEEAVELALYKEGDANTVAVAQMVSRRLEKIGKELPEGIAVVTGTDQSGFINASIREVLMNALLGGLIAVVILLFFLRDLRSTVIIGISIPLSVVATFFLMLKTDTSLNIMSLGGLALGVGMLVDNAIVVLEAIHKRREEGDGAFEAALRGASEVGMAVVASTLTTIAVFVPVVFLDGVAAQLFRDQALTVSFSLVASLAVSLTLIPMLAGGLRRRQWAFSAATPEDAGWFRRSVRFILIKIPVWTVFGVRWILCRILRFLALLGRPFAWAFDAVLGRISDVYPRVLGHALKARWAVVVVALAALAGTASLVPRLGLDLIPTLSQGEFSFRVELPEGTPLEATDRFLAGIQQDIEDDPRIESHSAIAGGAGLSLTSTGTEGENVGRIQVRMKKGTTSADETAVAALVRERLEQVAEARYKFERPSVFTFRTPVEVELYGDHLEQLHEAAGKVRDAVAEIDGVVDVKSSAELGNPELQVSFNREQLVQLGLDLGQVSQTVRNKIQGDVATRLTQGDREVDIVVRSVETGEASVDDVGDLIVGQVARTRTVVDQVALYQASQRGGAGGRSTGDNDFAFGTRQVTGDTVPIRLKTVAEIRLVDGPSEIRRIGQKRAAVISGNLDNRDMGAVTADLREALAATTLPVNVGEPRIGGQQEEMARSFKALMWALALAAFLVYLVMASQFESFLHPFVIIFTLPLGAIGVVLALTLTGNTVNVVALIGMVMLAGIVVNNAIVLIDAVNRLRREEGLSRHEALIEGGRRRLRPILMTSATTIFGLLPMALGLGEGAELRAPLAITVIGGLAVATLLTLIIIPVVYSLLDRSEPAREGAAEAAADPAAEALGDRDDLGGETARAMS